MDIFRGAPPLEVARLATKARVSEFRKSDFIFQEDEPAEAAWWVAEGIVKIAKAAPDGRMATMEMLTKGDVFAPAGVMKLQFYPANAIAVTDASAVRILKPDFNAFALAHPPVVQNVLQAVSQRLLRAHRLRALDSSSSEKKVAAALLWLSEKGDPSIGVSRREIAEIAGTAPETAIRIVLDFKKKKWVTATARSVSASNRQALQDFIDED